MSSSEHIPPPAPQRVIPLSSGPPLTSSSSDRPAVKGRAKSNRSHPVDADLSVFDILNIFRRRWFLSRPNLLANAISAQKTEDGNISWVEFSPPYHSHLVKSAVALVPHPVHAVKKVMFVYILELLNGEGDLAFFDLHKGGRMANNAQKEKRRLARKRSRAAKCERDREAAKAAKLPPRERQCEACGRKFESRKTAKKHKCPATKGASANEEGARIPVPQSRPLSRLSMPVRFHSPSNPFNRAPPAPSNNCPRPAVTGDSWLMDDDDDGVDVDTLVFRVPFGSPSGGCTRREKRLTAKVPARPLTSSSAGPSMGTAAAHFTATIPSTADVPIIGEAHVATRDEVFKALTRLTASSTTDSTDEDLRVLCEDWSRVVEDDDLYSSLVTCIPFRFAVKHGLPLTAQQTLNTITRGKALAAGREALNAFQHQWSEVNPHFYAISKLNEGQTFALPGELQEPEEDPIEKARTVSLARALIESCITIHQFDAPEDQFQIDAAVRELVANSTSIQALRNSKQADMWNMLVENQNTNQQIAHTLYA
ncbi:hypothetical protein EDB83DRAFT_2522866 [Lactarius deliciosus]|nr:hypothetical protein EDB83DRAFT_2522866 [Lactarius deliciosus]